MNQAEHQAELRLLGVNAEVEELKDLTSIRQVSLQLASQARKHLSIFTPDLEPALYDQQAFLDTLTRLAISSARAQIRVLLLDHDTAVTQGHRLIELARRLTSHIEIRCPGEDFKDEGMNFLLADGLGYVYREPGRPHQARACFNQPRETQRLQGYFDAIWETGVPDSELRRLYL